MGFFSKIKNGLKKTGAGFMEKVGSVLSGFNKIDEDLFDELEETLILCDIGAATSTKICDILRQKVKEEKTWIIMREYRSNTAKWLVKR